MVAVASIFVVSYQYDRANPNCIICANSTKKPEQGGAEHSFRSSYYFVGYYLYEYIIKEDEAKVRVRGIRRKTEKILLKGEEHREPKTKKL